MKYVRTALGRVPVTSIWLTCARCGEHHPIKHLRPPIGAEDDEDAPLLCRDCFLQVCEEQLEELFAHYGWTKKFEDGEWRYYPPEGADE